MAPPRDLFPTPEEIAERALEMCSQKHEPGRDAVRYWQEAEDELLERAAGRVVKSSARRKA